MPNSSSRNRRRGSPRASAGPPPPRDAKEAAAREPPADGGAAAARTAAGAEADAAGEDAARTLALRAERIARSRQVEVVSVGKVAVRRRDGDRRAGHRSRRLLSSRVHAAGFCDCQPSRPVTPANRPAPSRLPTAAP
jgi:hypothetical protein